MNAISCVVPAGVVHTSFVWRVSTVGEGVAGLVVWLTNWRGPSTLNCYHTPMEEVAG